MEEAAYKIRSSARAKNISISVTKKDGVVVIVPLKFKPADVPKFVESRRDWIAAAKIRIKAHQDHIAVVPVDSRPATIELRALNKTWEVEYLVSGSSTVRATPRTGGVLRVIGNIKNDADVAKALRRWTARMVTQHIVPWVWELGEKHQLMPSQVEVRDQHTRWASCSHFQAIGLNLRLIFLPEDLVRYVILHELAHISELNHSKKYWSLLASMAPDYVQNRIDVRESWTSLPSWLRYAIPRT